MSNDEEWLTNLTVSALWSGPDEQARVLTRVPQWSLLRRRGDLEGRRIPVRYVGSAVALPRDGWVDAEEVGPIDKPASIRATAGGGVAESSEESLEEVLTKSRRVAESSEESVAESVTKPWMQNHRETQLWSGPEEGAIWLTRVPQWSIFRRLGDQDQDRIPLYYYGNSLALPTAGWADAVDLGDDVPVPEHDPPEEPGWTTPPSTGGGWLQSYLPEANLWSAPDRRDVPIPGEQAIVWNKVPQWSYFQKVSAQQGGRIPVYFHGNTTAQPGIVWVDAAAVSDIGQPKLPVKNPDWPTGPDVADRVIEYGLSLVGIEGGLYCMGGKVIGGRGHGCRGIDCSGFVFECLDACGVHLGDRYMVPAEGIRQKVRRIDRSEAQKGDLIFFRNTYKRDDGTDFPRNHATHIGFWMNPDQMLDSNGGGIGNGGRGIGVSDLNRRVWHDHWLSMGRWRT